MKSLRVSRKPMDNLQTIEQLPGFRVGRFISESKNRFLCTIQVDGAEETCYIASSCRLDNFIDLRGKDVLLRRNTGRDSSTKYSILGVKHKRNYILLNTSWANRAVAADIHGRRFSYLGKRTEIKKESTINGYRSDFFIPRSKTIIEVKSVISTSDIAKFPTVFSERTLHQLDLIENLLLEGYKASFIIVSLNPYVKEIHLLENAECCTHIRRCCDQGLILKGYTCQLSANGEPQIRKEIPIVF